MLTLSTYVPVYLSLRHGRECCASRKVVGSVDSFGYRSLCLWVPSSSRKRNTFATALFMTRTRAGPRGAACGLFRVAAEQGCCVESGPISSIHTPYHSVV